MHYVLTGAGFTINWGGWSADKFFTALRNNKEVQKSKDLNSLLNKQSSKNFECVLGEVRVLAKSTPKMWEENLRILESAVLKCFEEMEKGYPHNPLAQDVIHLLEKYEVIFTLNQDCFLERCLQGLTRKCIHPGLKAMHPPKFHGASIINIAQHSDIQYYDHDNLNEYKEKPQNWSGNIPYIKLHGSMNWRLSGANNSLMIVGSEKEEQISQYPLITEYFNIFKNKLNRSNSKLLIIGYSFSDAHINKIIFDSMLNSSLNIRIWNTLDFVEMKDFLRKKIKEVNPDYSEFSDRLLNSVGLVYSDRISELIKDSLPSARFKHIRKELFA